MRTYAMERLGSAIAACPRLFAIAVAALCVVAAITLRGGIGLDGDLAKLLRTDTPQARTLDEIEADFHPFSTDEVLVVEAPDLGEPGAYEALQSFVSDLQLVDGVAAVMSVFMLPESGSSAPFLASQKAAALAPAVRLDMLLASHPLAADMLARDRSMTLVVVMADSAAPLSPAALNEIAELAAAHKDSFASTFAGIGAIHRSIEKALRMDLFLLATVATAICVLLALVVFRSWRGAIICAVPPVTGILWFFAFAVAAGIRVDMITTIVPVLLVVVGFADAVHLHFAWLRARTGGEDPYQAISSAFAGTAPACFLTSLTTAIACLGTGLAGAQSLNAFAWAGFAGMFIQFAAVMLVAPLLALWLGGGEDTGAVRSPLEFSWLARSAVRVAARPVLLVVATGVFFAGLVYAQAQLENGFRFSEHLREGSAMRLLEKRIVAKGLASGQIFVRIDDADGMPGLGAADRARLETAIRAIWPDSGDAFVAGLFPSAEEIDRLSTEGQPILGRFVSADRLHYLLPVPVDLSQESAATIAIADDIRRRLAAAGLAGATEIAGLPLLTASEVPVMIDNLRTGFYVSVVLVLAVLVHATGSPALGLISLAPNLAPILGVEAWLWATDRHLSMTAAVALTIAFGIAVDDSIHVLNRYQRARLAGDAAAMDSAVGETAAPITASTILLICGLGVTQLSSLPSVVMFGQLVAAALLLALAASLFMLPSWVAVFLPERKR